MVCDSARDTLCIVTSDNYFDHMLLDISIHHELSELLTTRLGSIYLDEYNCILTIMLVYTIFNENGRLHIIPMHLLFLVGVGLQP